MVYAYGRVIRYLLTMAYTGHWCRRYCICLLMALVNLVKSSHV